LPVQDTTVINEFTVSLYDFEAAGLHNEGLRHYVMSKHGLSVTVEPALEKCLWCCWHTLA